MITNRFLEEELCHGVIASLDSLVVRCVSAMRRLLSKLLNCGWLFWAALAAGVGLPASAAAAADRMRAKGTSIVFNTDAIAAAAQSETLPNTMALWSLQIDLYKQEIHRSFLESRPTHVGSKIGESEYHPFFQS